MKRRILCAVLSVLLLFASCEKKVTEPKTQNNVSAEDAVTAQTSFPYTFTDSTGYTVTLDKRPQKVAILFSSFADVWKTAGGSVDITVGESVERGFADGSAVIVDPSTGHTSIDLESLVEQGSDLVIGTADYDSQLEAVDFCRSAGINAALFKVETFEDYLVMLKICCDITGNTENYKTYGLDVKAKIDDMLFKAYTSSNRKKVLFVRAGSSAKSTKAKTTDDNFVCKMLSQLGAVNIADTDKELVGELSLERIVTDDPDYLFISTMGNEDAARDYMDSLLTSDVWSSLSCVKNGDYTYLPKNLFHYKPNSHWDEAYEYLIKILYPEIKF